MASRYISYRPRSARYDVDIAAGNRGSCQGYLKEPRGIAINDYSDEDHIYIVDKKNNRVQVFDSDMDYSFHFGSRPGEGKMMKPIGICISSEHNRVYVTQFSFNAVYAYKLDGTFVRRVGATGDDYEEFNEPYGLDVDECCDVFVCDRLNDRIQVFTKKLKFQYEISQLDHPIDVKVRDEELFVLDEGSKCVKVLTIGGIFLSQMISSGPGGRILDPYAFDIDEKGRIYISDCRGDCIQVFDKNGRYKYDIGEKGSGWGEFHYPTGVALTGRQLITVCERRENQIQVFSM